MFWIIAWQHLRWLNRQHILPLALALLTLAMAYPFVRSSRRMAEERSDETKLLQRAHAAILRNQQLARATEDRIAAGLEKEQIPPPFASRNPRFVEAWCRPPSILPRSLLAWLDSGQSGFHSAGYAGDEIKPVTNPLKLLIGEWDVGFAAVFVLPLIIIGLGFDLIASDKESGRLRLALSQPVTLRTILFARVAAVATVVLLSTAIIYATGVALSAALPDRGMILRASAGGVAILLYAIFWLALALGVNAASRSALTNALCLAGTWLLVVVLLPFAVDRIVTERHPVPPYSDVVDIHRSAPQLVKNMNRNTLMRQLGQLYPGVVHENGMSDLAALYVEVVARRVMLEQITDQAQDRWERDLAEQQAAGDRLAVVSPAMLLTSSLIELAGTSRARYLGFVRQTRAFDQQYEGFFLPRQAALPNSIFRSADYDLIPTMKYREEDAASVIRRATPAIGALAAFAGVAAVVALAFVWKVAQQELV